MADTEQEAVVESNPVEEQARAHGWVPKDEWDGPEEKHRTAEEFLDFGERVAPVLKKQRDEYKKKFDEMERTVAGLRATSATIIKQAVDKAKGEYDAQLTFVKQQLKQARSNGEFAVAAVLEDELDSLKEKKPEELRLPPQQPQIDNTTIEEWKSENTWFEQDAVMTKYALGAATDLKNSGSSLVGMPFFRAVEKEVKAAFPEKFQKRRSAVESNTPGVNSRRSGETSYASLSGEAKAACDSFVEEKLGTRDDYVKMYNAAK